jgi:hypothetical protein
MRPRKKSPALRRGLSLPNSLRGELWGEKTQGCGWIIAELVRKSALFFVDLLLALENLGLLAKCHCQDTKAVRDLRVGSLARGSLTRDVILAGPQIPAFHDPAKPHLHPVDLDIALDIDRYNFAMLIACEDGRLVARKEPA